jgi:nicotinamidase-related amidase
MLELRARRGDQVETVRWDPRRTALVIVDMWDDHWCRGAARRVGELAGAVDAFAREARRRGVFVLHAPSTTVSFYENTAARRRAREAPFARPPAPLTTDTRWGTGWCWPDPAREPALPIDDSDMGCDCDPKCPLGEPWKRQIAGIGIDDADAVTDSGQETWNLLAARGIRNVLVCGVHLNMCVLGRPFAIRQLVKLGRDVALVRDLTDTMYNSRMRPRVDHHAGTDLVVGHVEKYWCPSVLSTDLVGGRPFRFSDDRR